MRQLCDEHGIVMILDEVMAGFGRSGRWFAHQHFGIEPDIVTFAKGVNSGYVPWAAWRWMTRSSPISPRTRTPGPDLFRPPLAAAAAVANMRAMADEQMVENAAHLGRPSSVPGWSRSGRTTPQWATCADSARSGRSNWSGIPRPGSRWRPTARPMR
ncbi:aminotransferase class III-fold pyridoxal phosphate-dependent enzyme [Nesterenkonia pannonica]|uniref:aminotransferase class III-fold pyridoxal phosphate-dependent enzyme n=1 Tax=Nesterenkonia pannonica TaxID=1548602 RepID=UPI0021640914|nr:aminotransferase class III-fold pyridoxal phosphate-dependent enzyme [Nesterenkonia pannonica]